MIRAFALVLLVVLGCTTMIGCGGDGKPKPVAFPKPTEVGTEIKGLKCLRLETLLELKLASGMTNPGRLKDLADVQETVRALKLPQDFSEKLNPYAREKYQELWRSVQGTSPARE